MRPQDGYPPPVAVVSTGHGTAPLRIQRTSSELAAVFNEKRSRAAVVNRRFEQKNGDKISYARYGQVLKVNFIGQLFNK